MRKLLIFVFGVENENFGVLCRKIGKNRFGGKGFSRTGFTKDQTVVIASLFAVGLAPIAGQFGPVAGVLAGMLGSVIIIGKYLRREGSEFAAL